MATVVKGQVTTCPLCGADAVFHAFTSRHTPEFSNGRFTCPGCWWRLQIVDGLPMFRKCRARLPAGRRLWPPQAVIAYRKAMVRRFPMVEGTPKQAHSTVTFKDTVGRWGRMSEGHTARTIPGGQALEAVYG